MQFREKIKKKNITSPECGVLKGCLHVHEIEYMVSIIILELKVKFTLLINAVNIKQLYFPSLLLSLLPHDC